MCHSLTEFCLFLADVWVHVTRITHLLTSTVNPTATLQSGLYHNSLNLLWYIKANSKCFHKELSKSTCVWLVMLFCAQTGGFIFPTNGPCPSTPQPLTPKMMHLRFGANSPRPSPFYSPSSNPMQHFRCHNLVCVVQECLFLSPEIFVVYYQVYVCLHSLVHPSWVYKTLHWPEIHRFHTIPILIFVFTR